MNQYILYLTENSSELTSLSAVATKEHILIVSVKNKEELNERLGVSEWSAVVLDLDNLQDGYSLCQHIQQKAPRLPIFLVSKQTDEGAALKAFDLGAKDYLRKPMGPQEIVFRLKRAFPNYEMIKVGPLTIDLENRQLRYMESSIPLRRREFDIFLTLAKKIGAIATRESIIANTYSGKMISTQLIDSHISRIRTKIKKSGVTDVQIESVYGVGYMLSFKKADGETGF